MKWMNVAGTMVAVVTACHGGRSVTLQQIEAEVAAMERRAVERTLLSLFPDQEGWIVLPGVDQTGGSTAAFLDAYRVVASDSLPRDAWSRFLRGGAMVDLLEVSGTPVAPQRTRPAGFRGIFVRFSASGVEAAALLVDAQGMRWVAWYEMAVAALGDVTEGLLDSLGLQVASHLAGGDTPLEYSDVPPGALFYPPVPEPVFTPEVVWEEAAAASPPRLRGLPDTLPVIPDIALGRQIAFSAPPDPLANQEPFLLQRRLDALSGPRVVLSRARVPDMAPGTYLWAVSTLGQGRAVSVESDSATAGCLGPSVIFFGRPVIGVGRIKVNEHSLEADAFPGEYGLSPFCPHSLDAAAKSSRFLSRLGHLLAVWPGPEEGAVWPAIGTFLPERPCGWRAGGE